MKILIVDDNQQNLLLLEAILKGGGHGVASAANGIEALEKLGKESFDMIISDILMPGMDGFKLCVKCKEDEKLKALPFVFTTSSYTEAKDEEFGIGLGAEAFIIRPIEPEEFLKKIEEILKKKREKKEGVTGQLGEKDARFLEKYSERLASQLEHKILDLEKEVAERKQAEEELRLSEQRFRAIFDGANDGILIADPENKTFIDGNKSICRLLGYSIDELKKMGIMDIHPKEAIPYVIDQFEKQTKGEITVSENLPIKLKDGSVRYADVNANAIELGGKKLTIGIFRDITERQRAEEMLKVKDQAIESGLNAMAISDMAGNLNYVNPSFLKLWGYGSLAEVIGKSSLEFWQMGEKAAEAQEAVLTRGGWIGELVGKRKDGALFDVQIAASLVLSLSGQPVGMLASFIDITERKKMEKEMADKMAELEQYYKISMGREDRILELKETIKELKGRLGIT